MINPNFKIDAFFENTRSQPYQLSTADPRAVSEGVHCIVKERLPHECERKEGSGENPFYPFSVGISQITEQAAGASRTGGLLYYFLIFFKRKNASTPAKQIAPMIDSIRITGVP